MRIAEVASYPEYIALSRRLRDVGFTEDRSEGAPLCRWRNGDVILDVMPVDESILGFSNRWYKDAIKTANEVSLEPGIDIRVVSAPYFLGTKLEAFKGRGKGDFAMSQDLEDLIAVVDGRPAIVDEIKNAADDLNAYVAAEIGTLLSNADFVSALPAFLLPDPANQGRLPILLRRLRSLSQL